MNTTTRRRTLALGGAALIFLLSACGTRTGGGGGGGLFGSGLSPALEAQRKQMAQAFADTPVVIAAQGGNQLRVTVPLKHSFDTGRFPVKPALAKVLERLAPGVRDNPAATLRVRQPADDKASASLMRERAASLRDMLVGLGVPAARLQVSTDVADEAVTELVVSEPAAAVRPPATK